MSDSSRFVVPFQSPLGAGQLIPSGELNFYEAAAPTVRQNTYSDAALTIPNTNPVVADANGQFGDIFLSDGLAYAVVFTTSSVPPLVPDTLWTANPVASNLPAAYTGAAGGNPGTAGILPAPPANSDLSFLVPLANGLWGVPFVVPPAANVDPRQPGFLNIPLRAIAAASALLLADAGGALLATTSTPFNVSIPLDASIGWTAGVATPIVVHVPQGMGALTIVPAGGVTLLGPPSFTTSGSRVVGANGLATLTRWSTNYWTIAGANVS